jgi:hypothetical protein
MLTLTPPDAELISDVEKTLRSLWMPGDWFKLTPQVLMHYAWKAAICRSAFEYVNRTGDFRIIEIGTRAGYSLAVFRRGLAGRADSTALCFDAGIDEDSAACLLHFNQWVQSNRIPAWLVPVNTRDLGATVATPTGPIRWTLPTCDFAHIDGEHTTHGALRDIGLVWNKCPVILIDDCDNPEVLAAVQKQTQGYGNISVQYVNDGLRTLGVISPGRPTSPKG